MDKEAPLLRYLRSILNRKSAPSVPATPQDQTSISSWADSLRDQMSELRTVPKELLEKYENVPLRRRNKGTTSSQRKSKEISKTSPRRGSESSPENKSVAKNPSRRTSKAESGGTTKSQPTEAN